MLRLHAYRLLVPAAQHWHAAKESHETGFAVDGRGSLVRFDVPGVDAADLARCSLVIFCGVAGLVRPSWRFLVALSLSLSFLFFFVVVFFITFSNLRNSALIRPLEELLH